MGMSSDIAGELYFLFHSFLTGVLITILYDLLRIFRRVLPQGIIAVSVEDFLYWIGASILIFEMLYRENNGVLRWFTIAGAMAGMVLYKITVGFLFVKYVSLLINKILYIVVKALAAILRPLQVVGSRVQRKGQRSKKRLKMAVSIGKKKLTRSIKMLKITVSKR